MNAMIDRSKPRQLPLDLGHEPALSRDDLIVSQANATAVGLIDNWLRSIKDVYQDHRAALDAIDDVGARVDRLCELNIAQQVANVCHTTIVQNAWRHGRTLSVHGLIYDIHDGLLRDLGLSVTAVEQLAPIYRVAR